MYQIETTKANWLVVHSDNLPTALKAARDTGIPLSNIILMDNVIANGPYLTVDRLVEEGLSEPAAFMERKLVPSEARTKLAFLCFSSGTTGRPKAVAISHFSVITNIIQISLHSKVYMPTEQRRYRPGDVIYGGKSHLLTFNGSMLMKSQWYPSTVSDKFRAYGHSQRLRLC